MALSKKEAKDIAGDLFALADDIIKMKAKKKPMTKADLKRFRNRALQLAVKLTIDILD
jgi:hypothetical protein|tara:strand:+ start:256 stop:429 length:174 start_codon:yes stop_codon:yes gene_type:complete